MNSVTLKGAAKTTLHIGDLQNWVYYLGWRPVMAR